MSIAERERIKEFDIARVFAMICMVFVHTEFAIYNYNNATLGTIFDYLGSPFGAPIFMFILGANIYLSSKNTPKQLFIRGILLFVISIVFNIVCHALPFFILDHVNGTINFAENTLHWVFAVDILTFAGLAFMFFAGVKKFKLNNYILLIIAIVFSILNILLSKSFPIDFNVQLIPAVLTSLFYNSSITGYFSFLSWIVFPVVGYVFAQILSGIKNKNKFYLILGGVGLIVYLIMVYGSFNRLSDVPLVVYEDEYSFYQMHPYGALAMVFFCFARMSLLFFVSKIIPDSLNQKIKNLSMNLTIFYVIQWIIINYCLVLAFNGTLSVSEWPFILCSCCVFVISVFLSYLYKGFKHWIQR